MFGDEALIRAELNKHPALAPAVEIIHCTDVIARHEQPSKAIRPRKTTSMGRLSPP
jgi:glycerol-3-phosphate acyltransferase PlsX